MTTTESEVRPEIVPPGQVEMMVRAEVDVAVATARRYPRSLKVFSEEMALAVTDRELCERSYYSFMRGGKLIQGESIRFAEVLGWAYRNLTVATRFVGETPDGRFILVQAAGMDLERGTRVVEEVPRRIIDSNGDRYSDDMIGVTMRATASIARREVYLRLIPGVYRRPHFERALAEVLGDGKLEDRVARLAERAKGLGVGREYLLRKVDKPALKDLTPRDLLHLWGVLNALDDGMAIGDENGADRPEPKTVDQVVTGAGQGGGESNEQSGDEPQSEDPKVNQEGS